MNKKTIGWMLIILSILPFGFLLWVGQMWFYGVSNSLERYIVGYLKDNVIPLCMFAGFLVSGLILITRKPKIIR